MKEVWKNIDGYDGYYQVSNTGKIRSWKNNRWGKSKTPTIMTLTKNNDGYNTCNLSNNSIQTQFRVARLVGTYFVQNSENKPCINHINGIKTCDFSWNLEWVTYKENAIHAWNNNLQVVSKLQKEIASEIMRGSKHHNSKLNENDVSEIITMLSETDKTHNQIAKQFSVSRSTISKISNGKIWRHV